MRASPIQIGTSASFLRKLHLCFLFQRRSLIQQAGEMVVLFVHLSRKAVPDAPMNKALQLLSGWDQKLFEVPMFVRLGPLSNNNINHFHFFRNTFRWFRHLSVGPVTNLKLRLQIHFIIVSRIDCSMRSYAALVAAASQFITCQCRLIGLVAGRTSALRTKSQIG
jgi:hypothetical protein